MPELRKDPMTERWVIVNTEKPRKPAHYPVVDRIASSKVCPFCPGNEMHTPKSILEGKEGVSKYAWTTRVIPNKFPALRIEEHDTRLAQGMYDKVGGFGAHEIVIEHPEHDKQMADFTPSEMLGTLKAYRSRCLDLKKDPRFQYILIFKNYGQEAGASLEHAHSQIIGLPIVPSRVLSEQHGSDSYLEYCERCLVCDMIRQNESDGKLLVDSNDYFEAFCPFAGRFAFETWIVPRYHEPRFEHSNDAQLEHLARIMIGVLRRLKITLKDPSYNFMIHSAAIHDKKGFANFHWHIEIIPHLTQIAGFEMASGFYINQTPPEMAATYLREGIA